MRVEGKPVERRTLHELRQPPPLSSMFLGGFHRHDQSNVTDGLPPVEKSPTSSTLEFLCRLGSAWNSRVNRFSTSRRLDAWTNVRPLMTVSTTAAAAEAPLASAGLEDAGDEAVPPTGAAVPEVAAAVFVAAFADARVCRMTNVNVNVSSSSLESLRRNEGPAAEEASASCEVNAVSHEIRNEPREGRGRGSRQRTSTKSRGALSPSERDAATRVAGKALGAMLTDVRRRADVMTSDEIDTAEKRSGQNGLLRRPSSLAKARDQCCPAHCPPGILHRFWSRR